MISEIKTVWVEKNQERKILIVNLFFEVVSSIPDMDMNFQDLKRISLLLLASDCVESGDAFFKNLLAMATKEKISGQKDKACELIENHLRQYGKLIFITAVPNVLKNNRKSLSKFEKIQRIMDFNKKLMNYLWACLIFLSRIYRFPWDWIYFYNSSSFLHCLLNFSEKTLWKF